MTGLSIPLAPLIDFLINIAIGCFFIYFGKSTWGTSQVEKKFGEKGKKFQKFILWGSLAPFALAIMSFLEIIGLKWFS